MTSVTRTAQFSKVHKVLKKYYRPWAPPEERPVLEHLLFACCLEDARYEAAEEAFAALQHTFFDWNEVRVTSLTELSEVMAALPDPRAAANRVKRVLHGVFEQTYSFDLEDRRKKNLGPTEKWLAELDGTTKFTVAYVVQSALGGHSIPVDGGTVGVLRVLDLVTDKDAAEGVVPGLERAVAKNKGAEFGSLLHQLGADFSANPYSPQLREVLLQIDPECPPRFPKRRAPRVAEAESNNGPAPAETQQETASPTAAERPRAHRKKSLAAEGGEAAASAAEDTAAPSEPPPASEGKKRPGRKPRTSAPPAAPAEAEPADAPPAEPPEPPAEDAAVKPVEGLGKRKPR
jgi:endonuclease-3